MRLPTKAKMRAGDMKTPKTLPITAFVRAPASSPLPCFVMRTLEDIVVGVEHAIIILNF